MAYATHEDVGAAGKIDIGPSLFGCTGRAGRAVVMLSVGG